MSVSFPVGWGGRIHQLQLRRGIRPSHRVSWYDIKQSDDEILDMLENAEHPFIAIAPMSTLTSE